MDQLKISSNPQFYKGENIMTDDQLLVKRRPYNEESLLSFALNTMEMNFHEKLSVILDASGLNEGTFKANLSFLFKSCDLEKLAILTRNSVESLTEKLYSQTDENLYNFFNHDLARFFIDINKPKICPDCLKTKKYIPALWDLTFYPYCHEHNCMLINTCPDCGAQITWDRASMYKCKCGVDYREIDAPPIHSGAKLSNYIAARIYDQPLSEEFSALPLNELNLNDCFRLLTLFASQLNHQQKSYETEGKTLYSTISTIKVHRLLEDSFDICFDWPNNFHSFLKTLTPKMIKKHITYGKLKVFGTFYSTVSDTLFKEEAFSFLKNEFHNYLNSTSEEVCNIIPLQSSGNEFEKKYLTLTEAAKELQTREKNVKKLFINEQLKGVITNTGKRSICKIKASSVDEYKEAAKDLLTRKEVAALIGISVKDVSTLHHHQLLSPKHGPGIDDNSTYIFSKDKVISFISEITKRVQVVEKTNYDLIPFKSARLMFYTLKPFNIANILQEIFTEKITPYLPENKNSNIIKLSDLLFSKTEISSFISNYLSELKGSSYLTPAEIASELIISKTSARFLINKGFIKKSTDQTITGGFLIPKTAFDDYKSNFVLLQQLASKFNMTQHQIRRKLSNKGVFPISGTDIDGGYTNLYMKKDINKYDILGKQHTKAIKSSAKQLLLF